MFVELTVSDTDSKKKYILSFQIDDSEQGVFFLRNEEDEGMSPSEKNVFDLLDGYFKEEF